VLLLQVPTALDASVDLFQKHQAQFHQYDITTFTRKYYRKTSKNSRRTSRKQSAVV